MTPEQAESRQRYKEAMAKAYPSQRKAKHRLRVYNLTREQHEAMLQAQQHTCALCCMPALDGHSRGLVVDHDHATGLVRGLLCQSCNKGLGDFKDNPIALAKAIQYLLTSASARVQISVK